MQRKVNIVLSKSLFCLWLNIKQGIFTFKGSNHKLCKLRLIAYFIITPCNFKIVKLYNKVKMSLTPYIQNYDKLKDGLETTKLNLKSNHV